MLLFVPTMIPLIPPTSFMAFSFTDAELTYRYANTQNSIFTTIRSLLPIIINYSYNDTTDSTHHLHGIQFHRCRPHLPIYEHTTFLFLTNRALLPIIINYSYNDTTGTTHHLHGIQFHRCRPHLPIIRTHNIQYSLPIAHCFLSLSPQQTGDVVFHFGRLKFSTRHFLFSTDAIRRRDWIRLLHK
jgi:hypothetical protein